jgi:hypothetical protein
MPTDQDISHPRERREVDEEGGLLFAKGLALGAIVGLTATLVLLSVAYYFDWDRTRALVDIALH